MSEDKNILQVFFIGLVITILLAAFTLHPEKQKSDKVIVYVYQRFGLILANGVIGGIGAMLGQAVRRLIIKKFFK